MTPTPYTLLATHPGLASAARDITVFSAGILRRPLRHYQLQIARAVTRSIAERQGRVFTVMMARQMGKNELSAQLEAYLLYIRAISGGSIIKAAPTFKPQLVTSKLRLEELLARLPSQVSWRGRFGYILELGAATVHLLSADAESNVVGATASLLLEIDEAQDVDQNKYLREFRPMAATTNATTVLYGTAWSDDTLLAEQRAANLRDDPEAHFEFPYTTLAEIDPDYARFVETEIGRLGADHPVIKTQYLLENLTSAGRLFDADQLLLLQGTHPAEQSPGISCHSERSGESVTPDPYTLSPTPSAMYVAGVDIAGQAEALPDALIRERHPRKDSTVITIARVRRPSELLGDPLIEVVHHYWWTGRDHASQYTALLDLLQTRWQCRAVSVDATGVGAGVASWLARSMPGRVEQVQFTRPLKSELGYELLAAVDAGRLKMYAVNESKESKQFWLQAKVCRYGLTPSTTMNFYVDPKDGHDDFITSLALCVRAATHALPEPAGVILRPRIPSLYNDGRF